LTLPVIAQLYWTVIVYNTIPHVFKYVVKHSSDNENIKYVNFMTPVLWVSRGRVKTAKMNELKKSVDKSKIFTKLR
jgi:hypothetical protein